MRRGILATALMGWALAAQPMAAQEPINGVCDDTARNSCAAGRANDDAFPDHPTVYVWRCDGLNGGTNSEKCIKFVPVDGACDESARNSCAAGTANDDAFPDHPTVYVWRCDGLHGGENSEKCVKYVPVDGVCDDSARNSCSAGRANDDAFPDYPTVYVWRCDGLHGGTNSEKCIKYVPVDGACDDTMRNGCAAGTANDDAFPDDGTAYQWRCDGIHDGANSERCAISVEDVPIDGVCNDIKLNGCSAGTPNDDAFPNYPTIYVWRCDGLYGGANSEKCIKYTAVDGGWSDWSACSTSACATSGTQTRTCTNPAPEHNGQECLKLDGTRATSEERACAGNNPVDGGWSNWSACSATACGASGTQTRTCDNPAPGCGGSTCSGPSSRSCTGSNPVDGGWSAWSSCSASACGASGTRTRACNDPAPACGGLDCTGPSSQSCTGGNARNGAWQIGTWSRWSACGGSVCSSYRSRSVTCIPPACGGAPCDQSSKPAASQTSACPSPAWQAGSWSGWSACSATACGVAGTQTRTRAISCPCGSACTGTKPASSQTQSCTGSNPRQGIWQTSAWGRWTACSASACNQSRTRTVTCAPPGCGGSACNPSAKPSGSQTQSCSNPPSPQWTIGQWGTWSSCSATGCRMPGNQTRTRTVSCPCGSTACPNPKPAEEQTLSCTGTCRECEAETLTWGNDCSARTSTADDGSSVTLANAASCRTGSATFTCNAPDWSSPTNATCSLTRTNGSCNNAVTNGCATGTFRDVADTAAQWKWACVGSCDGTTAECSKPKQLSLPTVSVSASGSGGRGTATAYVSGGTPPYTYSWSVWGAGSIQGSSSGASVNFTYRSGPASAVVDIRVNVTDSAGLSASAETIWGTPPRGP